ncbi:MAG: MerR family transcriptional regulator [Chlorobi bacterium]|nr:MerR family transcriptional regulator [Chlorobiota bacterium]MCI0717191.1 MerR family transcriptional regulator [Chlorobiota bacterium]
MTIGQLAKLTNLNTETIRYYESLKLIPKPKTKESGYRNYTRDDVDTINYIKKAKQLGFTLKEIKSILNFESCEDLYELTSAKLNEVQQKLEFYKELALKLNTLIKSCPKSGEIQNCSIIKSIRNNKVVIYEKKN